MQSTPINCSSLLQEAISNETFCSKKIAFFIGAVLALVLLCSNLETLLVWSLCWKEDKDRPPNTEVIVSSCQRPAVLGVPGGELLFVHEIRSEKMYLVAPNRREKEVIAQLARPAFRNDLADIALAFIPFNELRDHCDALCKFGEDHTILRKIAHGAIAF